MIDIRSSLKGVADREKWAARGASFVAKARATKVVWFPPEPVEGGKKAASAATKATTRATGKTAGAATKATRKTAAAGPKATKKTTGAGKKTTNAAKKVTNPASRKKA